MTAVAGQQALPFPLRVWSILGAPRVRVAIAVSGAAAALGGGLLALALVTAILSLQGAGDEYLHSVGVLVEPFVVLLGFAAVFAFPDGRLSGRTERLILAFWALYFLVGFVPYFFFSPVVPGGAPLAGCNAACPANGLMIADRRRWRRGSAPTWRGW